MTDLQSLNRTIPKAFPGITPSEAEELIATSSIKRYPEHTILCHENKHEDTFYIILDGEVQVTKTINHVEDRLLKKLVSGDFFGEMALIHNAPRAATVTTLIPTTVLEIQKSAFDHVLERSSSVSMALTREISRRLQENDGLAIEDLRLRAAELARAYEQLTELDYARREFLATITHELKTPLAVANTFIQAIQTEKLEGNALYGALDTVTRNISQIVSLVNDILFLQEMDLILPKFQTVNLGEIIKYVSNELGQRAFQNHVTVNVLLPADLPTFIGDSKSLERAFRALIDNAIKFSPEGGDVNITGSVEQKTIRIEIEDHGLGIEPNILPMIFDRFFHVEQIGPYTFRGAGLGLSIAKQVVEQHSGRIEVKSQPGQGSLFRVIIELN